MNFSEEIIRIDEPLTQWKNNETFNCIVTFFFWLNLQFNEYHSLQSKLSF